MPWFTTARQTVRAQDPIASSKGELQVMCGGFQKELKGEDRFMLHDASVGGDHCYFALVADGHGGKDAVQIAAQRILPLITQEAKDGSGAELNRACVKSFRTLHEEICASGTTAGSTLTVCCMNASRHELHVWNVGDSLAVLVDADGHAPLGMSHRLETNPDEQARLQAFGVKLRRASTAEGKEGGPLRAWPGGLAVTRCVGDADCHFVIPEPAWSTCPAPPKGGALLACTDGVWDLMSADEAAMILVQGAYDSARQAARQVVHKAVRRGLIDDTTAVVLLFGPAVTEDLEMGGHALEPAAVEGNATMGPAPAPACPPARRLRKLSGEILLDYPQGTPGVVHVDESPSPESSVEFPIGGQNAKLEEIFDRSTRNPVNVPLHVDPNREPNRETSPALRRPPPKPLGASAGGALRLSVIFDSVVGPQATSSAAAPPWAGGRLSPPSQRSVSSSGSPRDSTNRFALCTSDAANLDEAHRKPGPSGGDASFSLHDSSDRQEFNRWRIQYSDAGGAQKPSTQVVDFSKLTITKYLGQGEFARAHETTLDGRPAAIKMLKKEKQEIPSAVQGLKREIMLMTLMDHPNVLKAYALGQHEGIPLMIVELLSRTLPLELTRDPDTVPFWVRWREVKRWPLSRSLHCAVQLARALKYCHDDAFPGYRILHRDVKPNNIGFINDPEDPDHLVLFDFGLASLWGKKGDPTDTLARDLSGETGSLRYMAPEVANSRPYCPKAEVFSFATVTYEIASRKKPFTNLLPDAFRKALGNGYVPEIPRKWPAELQSLISVCWKLDAQQRPEFREIVPRLEALCAEHPQKRIQSL
jgi:serine/threonine protein phosphatase PrpC